MVNTRSGKDHSANPPPTKRGQGRGGRGGRARGSNRGTPLRSVYTPPKEINRDIEDSILTLLGPSPKQSSGGRSSNIQSDKGRLSQRKELQGDGTPQVLSQTERTRRPAKGKTKSAIQEAVQDPKIDRSKGKRRIKAKTLQAKAEEEREQVEREFLHGLSSHGGQGRD
ncbi:hypothetical protein PTTG_27749 [Puccinia triticina 1-1 BBBD Race 1]|uniref:Uncharacterized protein n=1 Tax=Puccinia triticina (isolate 1-1 / race 1 (BBBD)) TaxID=630390 RepID=A0A180GHG1_PUCT1|nr:hypothetical protein PTTG_27749 [Puccinia triticina 1-1 BBBD Race 1]